MATWLLEVEMGVVWGVASLSIISFIFASIWYIDPALLTMVLQFQVADCTTVQRLISENEDNTKALICLDMPYILWHTYPYNYSNMLPGENHSII